MAAGGADDAVTPGETARGNGCLRVEELVAAAGDYLRRGYQPVPIPAASKSPIVRGWQHLRLRHNDLRRAFASGGNIGLLLGSASHGLVDVDLDCVEARHLADEFLPPTPAETGRAKSPRSHRWYICPGIASVRHQDPIDRSCLLEIRSTGSQTLVGPSIHPSGDRYWPLVGEPALVDRETLLAAVATIAERIIRHRHGAAITTSPSRCPTRPAARPRSFDPPADDRARILRRASAYLGKMPPAVAGQGGHNATYAAATVLVHGFELTEAEALVLLKSQYNPRCQPAWSDRELEHKVSDAAAKPHDKPRGWLRRSAIDQSGHGSL
jgi:hypothetical protein